MNFDVQLISVQVFDESLNLSCIDMLQVEHFSAPHLTLVKGLNIETRYYTEIIPTAFQCGEQILVAFRIGVDDVTVGKDDFVINDVVANEPTGVREIG